MLRVKGFAEVAGKPMRLVVQAVGPRVSHHYDRPWGGGRGAGDAAGGDRAEGARPGGGRADPRRPDAHPQRHHGDPGRPDRAGRSRARRRRRSWPCPSPTATSRRWRRRGGRGCRSCGWRACATCGTRCRSTSGSSGWRRRRGWSLVRLLGGYDWWAYGCDRLAALARERGIALALLPGECREADARLAALSTVPAAEQAALLACFREGGPENMRGAARAAGAAGRGRRWRRARRGALPRAGVWLPAARHAAARRRWRRRGGRWCRSCSIARCCSRTTMRRSRRWRRRWRRRGSRRCRCSCRACATRRVGGDGRAGAGAARGRRRS